MACLDFWSGFMRISVNAKVHKRGKSGLPDDRRR